MNVRRGSQPSHLLLNAARGDQAEPGQREGRGGGGRQGEQQQPLPRELVGVVLACLEYICPLRLE